MDEAQPCLHGCLWRVSFVELLSKKLDEAGVRRNQPTEDVHQRALAGAVAAHQSDDLGTLHVEIDSLYSLGGTEGLIDTLHSQQVSGGSLSCTSIVAPLNEMHGSGCINHVDIADC